MRHLPKTEYTDADQRADTAFLVGVGYGAQKERGRIVEILQAADVDIPEGVET